MEVKGGMGLGDWDTDLLQVKVEKESRGRMPLEGLDLDHST